MNLKYPPKNIIWFVLVNVFIITLISLVVSWLPFSESPHNPVVDLFKKNSFEFFLMVMVVGPLFETLLFQTVIIRLTFALFSLIKSIKKKYINIIEAV